MQQVPAAHSFLLANAISPYEYTIFVSIHQLRGDQVVLRSWLLGIMLLSTLTCKSVCRCMFLFSWIDTQEWNCLVIWQFYIQHFEEMPNYFPKGLKWFYFLDDDEHNICYYYFCVMWAKINLKITYIYNIFHSILTKIPCGNHQYYYSSIYIW